MKKNILKITFTAALAVVAGVTAYQAQNKEMPCCKYTANKYSACSAIDVCP